MNRSETINLLSASLLSAQKEMGGAVKGANNPFFRSKFADLNSIREATIPVLNKHGITVLQPTAVLDGKNYVETTLLHESGQFLSALTEVVTAKANDPQAHGSGLSYSRRYGLQALLCVASVDDDGEAAMAREVKGNPGKNSVNGVAVGAAGTGGGGMGQTTTDNKETATVTPAKRASFRKNTTVAATKVTNTQQDDI